VIVAERRAELIGRDGQILAVAKPGLDLRPEATLLQLIHQPLEIAEVCLRQYGRDKRRRRGRFDLAQVDTKRAPQSQPVTHCSAFGCGSGSSARFERRITSISRIAGRWGMTGSWRRTGAAGFQAAHFASAMWRPFTLISS
jgi:hypothetical protein